MHIAPADHFATASRRLPVSEKVRACARRFQNTGRLRVAELDEALGIISTAAEQLDLASIDILRAVHGRNPHVFRIVEADHGSPSLIAYLPLNAGGVEQLVDGHLDGQSPDPALIAGPAERAAGIYIWLVWAPRRLAKTIPSLLQLVDELTLEGCPIFSRAVTEHARRLNASVGFKSASRAYDGAPEWLLILQSEKLPPKIDVQIARSFDDMAHIYAVRSATYLAEQFCLYSEEFDGNDFCATQFIGRIDGDAAGCLRLRYFHDFVKVERLAVRREYRQSKLAFKLVRAALDHAAAKGFSTFYGHSREDLVRFWQVFGFKPIPDRPQFRFADVDYREIALSLPSTSPVIGHGSNPMHTIRPEGAWHSPGPLEASGQRSSRYHREPILRRLVK